MEMRGPLKGWNSWNTFGANINDALIRESAEAVAKSGLKDAGYDYIVIDDCWSLKDRDADGRLVADPALFPHGMKDLADYIHSLGFKFGMYSCVGTKTCAGYPGSFGHEFQDALRHPNLEFVLVQHPWMENDCLFAIIATNRIPLTGGCSTTG